MNETEELKNKIEVLEAERDALQKKVTDLNIQVIDLKHSIMAISIIAGIVKKQAGL